MMAGMVASILPAWLVLTLAKRFDKKLNIPMRDTPGTASDELKSIVDKKDHELPGLFVSFDSCGISSGSHLTGIDPQAQKEGLEKP